MGTPFPSHPGPYTDPSKAAPKGATVNYSVTAAPFDAIINTYAKVKVHRRREHDIMAVTAFGPGSGFD